MNISKFQNGTKDYDVGVIYSTHQEEFKLQSNDRPASELYLHAESVVLLATELFGLKGLRAELREIAFSSGQHGPTSRVSLRVPTSQGDDARMVLPAVSRADLEDAKTHEVDPIHPRNAYNLAVNLLEASITAYVQGRRQQAVFDFNAEVTRKLQDGVDDILAHGARLSSLQRSDDEEDDDESGDTPAGKVLAFAEAHA